MSSVDYLPRRNGDLIIWLTQFKTELTNSTTELGLLAADVTAISTNITDLLTVMQDQAGKVADQQAATAAKKSAMGNTLPQVRALARRIKSLPTYTPELGERLGIVAPGAGGGGGLPAPGVRPELFAGQVRNGHVAVGFRKNGFTGVQIVGRRGSETDFALLKAQLRSPFIDERPNAVRGPETRYYQARYLDNDELTGEASDILVVTVPE